MTKEKKVVAFVADIQLLECIDSLKKQRRTRNTAQIVREALWVLAEKILPGDIHICNDLRIKEQENGRN